MATENNTEEKLNIDLPPPSPKQDSNKNNNNNNEHDFKAKIEHHNVLTDIVKFMDKQPKNIHIYVKNIIQKTEPHLLNDSASGININISKLKPETFTAIKEYMNYIKTQNKVLNTDR